MSAPAHIARENGKKGGRPKGKKSAKTLEREAVLRAFRERAMRSADLLFDAQLSLAKGQTFLYKIEKELQIGPKGGKKYVNSKPKLVTNQNEIEGYLEGLVNDGDMEDENDPNATYYYLTTKEPSNYAADSLLDRTFGKATQRLEHTGEGGRPINIKFDNAFSNRKESK